LTVFQPFGNRCCASSLLSDGTMMLLGVEKLREK